MPRITGLALDVEHGTQTITDDHGQPQTIRTTTVHVLDGREVVPVKIARNFSEVIPEKGDTVDLHVMVRPWAGRSGPQLTFTALRTFDADALASVTA